MKRALLLFLVFSAIVTNSFTQYSRGELKDQFYNSESYVLFEEYQEALPGYELNLRVDPTNYNIRYRIGQCLLNIPGRKHEAISYLEAAVKEINPKYKEGKFTEKKAPFDAYYYLANAYRIDNQLEKAIATYEIFKQNLDPKIYDIDVVNLQIESCHNALESMKTPRYLKKTNLGEVINDRLSEINPVVSADETIMVYNRTGGFQDALFYSRKENGKWRAPVNIIPELGLGFEEGNYATSLSTDGKELYIYRPGDDYDGNIYVTRRDGDRWSVLEKLNNNINTKYWESHAAISHDGKKLYFTSNRKGTLGGLDIYVSEKDSTGDWGPSQNLGTTINTIYNEETPFLGENDKILYFSSRGHFNIGGHDIFYSSLLEDGTWSIPLNAGYPLNTTDEDVFFNPTGDGYTAYFSLIDSTGFGLADIYYIEVFSDDHPRKFIIRGIAQVRDLLKNYKDSIKVSALNINDPNARVIVYTDPVTGEYIFELPQGDYSIAYEARGAEKTTRDLELQLTNPADSFILPTTTLPRTDFEADMEIMGNQRVSVGEGDSLSIGLRVEPNSILSVEHWLGDSLLFTEKFVMTDTLFVYKTLPKAGEDKLVFSLEDRFGNVTTSEIFITRKKPDEEQKVIRPEYKRIIAEKQINVFNDLLNNRAEDELSDIVRESDFGKQQFGRIDDAILYLKQEASKKNISPEEVDRLALKVAAMDNILSQAAVDLLAAYSDGLLKEILDGLNIYDAGLKTWTDLQQYVFEKSGGKIKPEDLNKLAADILAGLDPRIEKIRNKVLDYSSNNEKGPEIIAAVTASDSFRSNTPGEWLNKIFSELLVQGLSEEDIARLFSVISALPDISIDDYLAELIKYSEKPLADYLKGISLSKNRIRTPEQLVLNLLKVRDLGFFSEQNLFKTLADITAAKNIPSDIIKSQSAGRTDKNNLLALWIILGAGLIFFFIFYRRKKKKDKDTEQ